MATVGRFPVVRGGKTLEQFLDRLMAQSRPVLPFQWRNWLRSSSLKSTYFNDIPDFANFIGISDADGPTDDWDKLRSRENHQGILLGLLRTAYSAPLDFLSVDQPSEEERSRLVDWVKTNTGADESASERAVETMIKAFDRALGRAPARAPNASVPARASKPASTPSIKQSPATRARVVNAPKSTAQVQPPTLQIAVQVNISPGMSAEEVDRMFASMARHLYGGGVGS